jgi:hypothetical protein
MCSENDKLVDRKKIRTYSKRLLTALSVVLTIGYAATLVCNVTDFSLHLAIIGAVLSAISLALNIWSLTDHFRKQNLDKKNTSEQEKKLTKISLDIASSISFLAGGVTSLVFNIALHEASGIYFISASLFTLGYAIMAVNTIRWLIDSKPQTQKDVVSVDKLSLINEGVAPK